MRQSSLEADERNCRKVVADLTTLIQYTLVHQLFFLLPTCSLLYPTHFVAFADTSDLASTLLQWKYHKFHSRHRVLASSSHRRTDRSLFVPFSSAFRRLAWNEGVHHSAHPPALPNYNKLSSELEEILCSYQPTKVEVPLFRKLQLHARGRQNISFHHWLEKSFLPAKYSSTTF